MADYCALVKKGTTIGIFNYYSTTINDHSQRHSVTYSNEYLWLHHLLLVLVLIGVVYTVVAINRLGLHRPTTTTTTATQTTATTTWVVEMDPSSQIDNTEANSSQGTAIVTGAKRNPSELLSNPGIKCVNYTPDIVSQDIVMASQLDQSVDKLVSRHVKNHLDIALSQILQSHLLPLQQMIQVNDSKISQLSNDLGLHLKCDKLTNHYQHNIEELPSEIVELKPDQAKTVTTVVELNSENNILGEGL